MKNFMAFMNQTSAPVLIVMGSLLLLFLMIAVSGRADEQSERAWAAWCQSHPDIESKADGSGV